LDTTTAPPTKCTYQPSQQQPLELHECFILSSELEFSVTLKDTVHNLYYMSPSFSDDGTATIHTKTYSFVPSTTPSVEDIKISKNESVNHTFYFPNPYPKSLPSWQKFEFVNMGPENGIKVTYISEQYSPY